MAQRGRPPKPTELKRKLGNPGHRPIPTALTVIAPTAPDAADMHVPESGLDLIQHLLDSGAKAWIGATDVATVEVARQLWEDRRLARARWIGTMDKDDFNAYNHLTRRLTECLSSMGLDPASRSRLGVAEVKAKSVLEKLAERREKRLTAGHRGT